MSWMLALAGDATNLPLTLTLTLQPCSPRHWTLQTQVPVTDMTISPVFAGSGPVSRQPLHYLWTWRRSGPVRLPRQTRPAQQLTEGARQVNGQRRREPTESGVLREKQQHVSGKYLSGQVEAWFLQQRNESHCWHYHLCHNRVLMNLLKMWRLNFIRLSEICLMLVSFLTACA